MDTRRAARTETMRPTHLIARMFGLTCAALLVLTTTWATTTGVRAAEATDDWEPARLPELTESARLEPSERDSDGITTDAFFTLTSLGDTPVADLAAGLSIDPPIELDAVASADPTTLRLIPAEVLSAGQRYRFELRDTDGSIVGSWIYRTQAPLQVIGTLPDDGDDWARPNTGIEIAFDHEDPISPSRYFAIEPQVKGRFEVRGNTLSFIPSRPLATGTKYTVSLRPGLAVKGSDARLEEPFSFTFQTRPGKADKDRPVGFVTEVVESAPGQAPIIEVWLPQPGRQDLEVAVHRFRRLDDVIEAVRTIQHGSDWGSPPTLSIRTDGLQPMGSMTGSLRPSDPSDDYRQALTLPRALSPGWYLLTIEDPDRDRQAILQVSDLATYAHVSRTDSLFWVNSVAGDRPVQGAEVSLVGGESLGSTDAEGLLVIDTPEALTSTEPVPLVLVRSDGAAVLLPFAIGQSWSSPNIERGHERSSPRDRFWTYLNLDRYAYRSTDAVNVWGMVRSRDDGTVPADVELRLLSMGDDWDESPAGPALATAVATPSATGVFSASLAYEDLPLGDYVVEASAEGERIGSEWFEVRSIVKPAYRLSLATERRALMDGEDIDVAVEASFFDGTAVPAAPLAVTSRRARREPTTDASGSARTSVPATHDHSQEQQIGFQHVVARPRNPEQGEITGGTQVAVVASTIYLDAEAVIERGSLRLDGHVHELDLDRLDRQMSAASPSEEAFWEDPGILDPRGRPAGGVQVTARVTRFVPVRRKTGTVYDFIAKRVIPTFDWRARKESAGVFDLTADADGAYSLEIEGAPRSGYSIDLSATDAKGRTARQRIWAEEPYRDDVGAQPYLALAGEGNVYDGWRSVSVGDELRIELRQGRQRQPRGGPNRYLFLVQYRGLREHVLQQKPVLDLTFREEYAPSVTVGAVRFTGDSYVVVPDGLTVRLDAGDRALGLEISPAQERYAPGDTVELTVRTTDRDGQPVPASVVLHAVDEKLYAMGLVGSTDPLHNVYAGVGSGLVRTYASHQLPGATVRQFQGDTAGGGGGSARADFRDVLLFRQVETDADGRATVLFDASDDLTSWRIAGAGVSDSIEVGAETALVSVGLPFFVDVVAADDYLVADEARISIRAYGDAVSADDPVTFTVTAPSLGLDQVELTGSAFRSIDVPLPPLTEGVHDITVSASAVVDGVDVRDAMVRQVRVLPSRLVHRRAAHVPLMAGVSVPGGTSLTDVVVGDEGRGRFYPALIELAASDGPRADEALAASQARHLLQRWFAGAGEGLADASFDVTQFQRGDGSIALLPYGGRDEALSFLVALAAPDAIDGPRLARWFREIQEARKTTRERALRAAVARAALGEDVLGDLESITAEGPLSATDSLVYALGLASAGAHDAALAIERELLAEHGQQLGDWVRLRLPEADGSPAASTERVARETALLAILAAELGDDATALAADAYVRENPTKETIAALQHIAVIDRLVGRSGAEPASFSLELDGDRHVVDLEPGATHRMTLTAPQRAAASLAPVLGRLGVSSTWPDPIDVDAPGQAAGISVKRSVRPRGRIAANGMAEVTIEVRLGEDAVRGCYLVTDMAPSGLAPVRSSAGWPKRRKNSAESPRTIRPIAVQGQRVDFCIFAGEKRSVRRLLRYMGRVVTPGAYVWEPTLVQSTEVPSAWRVGEASRLVLGTTGEVVSGGALDDASPDPGAGRAPSTRKEHENVLMDRLAPYECARWRQDDQPFDHGAVAAVQCRQPDFGLSQVALFTFPDGNQLREFWDWRVDQIDLGSGGKDVACADGRPGLVSFDGGQVACYLSGAGAGIAKIRWIDEGTATYGVLDATDGDIAALHAWWSANRR